MPRYQLFQRLPLFAHVEAIHIRYNPTAPNGDTCRRLMLQLLEPKTFVKLPQLKFSYELLSYDARPEITLVVYPQVPFRFYADEYNLHDIHQAIDQHQYNAHTQYLKKRSLEQKFEMGD